MSKLNSVKMNRFRTRRATEFVVIAGVLVSLGGVAAALGTGDRAVAAPQVAAANPVNTASPVISGPFVEGQVLSATNGSWTTTEGVTFSYLWRRCDETGSNCPANIAGAINRTYTLTAADVGHSLRVVVIATFAGGNGSAISAPTGVISALNAPVSTAAPVVSGSTVVGQILTTSDGVWTGTSPISFTYQWRLCDQGGGNCPTNIAGATANSYTLTAADVGHSLRAVVIARNIGGISSAISSATAVISESTSPVNTSPPLVSGAAQEGQRLTSTTGAWTSGTPISFSYLWRRCDITGGNCPANIAGATQQTYTATSADVGHSLRTVVIAKNASGTTSVLSVPTAVVAAKTVVVRPPAPKPAPTGCPAGTDTIRADQLTAPARLLIDRQSINPSVVGRSTRDVTVRFHVSACGGRSVQGVLVYATAVPYNQFAVPSEQPTGTDGWAQLTTRQLRGFPAARSQQLLVMFVRARKANENVLGGVSTRRLVSFPVDLGR